MGLTTRLKGLDADEFERLCLDSLIRMYGPQGARLSRRGGPNHADEGVDIEGIAGEKRVGFQCKTGRIDPNLISSVAADLARYPKQLDVFVILCADHATPKARERFESLRSQFRTVTGAVPDVELWGPDELAQRFGDDALENVHTGTIIGQAFARHRAAIEEEYSRRPVWRASSLTLEKIYVDLDCGVHMWGDITASAARGEGMQIDPFAERSAPRQDLLLTAMDWLSRDDFREFLVIQGTPGAGKSSFTIRLAVYLAQQGYRPIRVRLRDLSLTQDPLEEIGRNVFGLAPTLFEQALQTSEKSPVLILDGWDELSLLPEGNLSARVGSFLDSIRANVLIRWAGRVRVVLTGRPSNAVT